MRNKKITDDVHVCSPVNTKNSGGIGTLNEHSLHAFLKETYEPDSLKREIKIGRYVADIENSGKIIEIQTRGFFSLKKKLAFFLKDHDVTVVYPVAQIKRLFWVDPVIGETSPPRKSPKTGKPFEIFYELIHIKELLCEPRLSFKIVMLELDEYRNLDGWSRDRKKGSTRKDRVPISIFGEVDICKTEDYLKLMPDGLSEKFTVPELMKCGHMSRTLAQRAVTVLCAVGVINRVGKAGRAYLYSLKDTTDSQKNRLL
jgi:hypothetical protein